MKLTNGWCSIRFMVIVLILVIFIGIFVMSPQMNTWFGTTREGFLNNNLVSYYHFPKFLNKWRLIDSVRDKHRRAVIFDVKATHNRMGIEDRPKPPKMFNSQNCSVSFWLYANKQPKRWTRIFKLYSPKLGVIPLSITINGNNNKHFALRIRTAIHGNEDGDYSTRNAGTNDEVNVANTSELNSSTNELWNDTAGESNMTDLNYHNLLPTNRPVFIVVTVETPQPSSDQRKEYKKEESMTNFSSTYRLYIDGKQQNEFVQPSSVKAIPPNDTEAYFEIGTKHHDNATDYAIKDFKVYNQTIPRVDVGSLYNAIKKDNDPMGAWEIFNGPRLNSREGFALRPVLPDTTALELARDFDLAVTSDIPCSKEMPCTGEKQMCIGNVRSSEGERYGLCGSKSNLVMKQATLDKMFDMSKTSGKSLSYVQLESNAPIVEVKKTTTINPAIVKQLQRQLGGMEVTQVVKDLVAKRETFTISNTNMQGDPVPGRYKKLYIEFRYAGKTMRVEKGERTSLAPAPPTLEVLYAFYGTNYKTKQEVDEVTGPYVEEDKEDVKEDFKGTKIMQLVYKNKKPLNLGNNGITICFWFRFVLDAKDDSPILKMADGSGDAIQVVYGDRKMKFRVKSKNDRPDWFELNRTLNTLNLGEWYHITWVMQPPNDSGKSTWMIYANASSTNLEGYSGQNYPSPIDRPLVFVGATNWWKTKNYNGSIGDLRIYKEALNRDQVMEVFNNPK